MPIPTFTLTGSIFDLKDGDGNGTVDSVAVLSGAQVTFTPNTFGQFLSIDGNIYRPQPVTVTVDSSGRLNGTAGVVLLANDPVLDLEVPLQWQVRIEPVVAESRRLPVWWFEAPASGTTRTVGQVVAVAATAATGWTKGDKGEPGGFAWKGAWSSATIYALLDLVQFEGSTYACLTAGTVGVSQSPATAAGRWSLVSSKGDIGVTGPVGDTGATGATGPSGTVAVGSTTTGSAGSSASVVNSGSSTAAVLNFTVPRGTAVTVGSTTTGDAGSAASVSNSGTVDAAVLDFTVPRGTAVTVGSTSTGLPGSSAVVSNSGTVNAAVLNFTVPRGDVGPQGAPGTPGSVTIAGLGDATTIARRVVTTATGGNGVENGANTWAKLVTLSPPVNGSSHLLLGVSTGVSYQCQSAIISVFAYQGSIAASIPQVAVQIIGMPNSGTAFLQDGFKLVNNGYAAPVELWIKKGDQYTSFNVTEISRSAPASSVTYNDGAAWQSAEPVGSAINTRSTGVTIGGAPVVTTTGVQTLTGKTLTGAKLDGIKDINGAWVLGLGYTASAVNYLYTAGNVAGSSPTLQSVGADANISLSLVSKGTGSVTANYVPVATTTGAQTITNKTISGATNTLSAIPQTAITALSSSMKTLMQSGGNGIPSGSMEVSELLQRPHLLSTEQFRSGTQSFKTVGHTWSNFPNTVAERVPVSAGDTLYSEVWVYGHASNTTTAQNLSMRFDFFNAAGTYVADSYHNIAATDALNGVWTKIQGTAVVPAGTTSYSVTLISLQLGSSAHPGHIFYWDDLRTTLVNGPVVTTTGTQTLTGKTLIDPKVGTGPDTYIKDSSGNNLLYLGKPSASAVNWVAISNDVTGQPGRVGAWGNDTNVSLNLTTKGSGTVQANGIPVVTTTGAQALTNKTLTNPTLSGAKLSDNLILDSIGGAALSVNATASSVNHIQISNRAAGSAAPTIRSIGSDTDIGLELGTKGSGVVTANLNPVGVKVAVPTTATSTGVVGQWAADSSWHYVCTAANTWRRAALSTW